MRSAKSKRARKRHVQQALFRQGGKRRGAGRKPKGARAGERHEARPEFKPYHALHVVMRVLPAAGSLRRRVMYKAVREATITAAMRERFRLIHVSLQRNHIHMLVEAENKAALARGMQGFQISAARNINTALGDGKRRRRGRVFADRYHLEVITTPTQARHAIASYSATSGNMAKIGWDWPAPGWSIRFPPASCFPTGRSSRTGQSCGQSAGPTIRWWCTGRGVGSCERVGRKLGRSPAATFRRRGDEWLAACKDERS